MRLLQCSHAGEFSFTKDFVGEDLIPPYAILSHTWKEGQEVTFQDIIDDTGRSKAAGFDKIQFCRQQAERDGLRYFWVDTCCIDKSNYGELKEALNSMFCWYQNAVKCYVYLSDVSIAKRKASDEVSKFTWESALQVSKWFTRGWTLQELLAPRSVEFFSREWKKLGDKRSLTQQIYKITGIPQLALQGTPLSQFSVNIRLSWIGNRHTTVEEDEAYSLLGIFGVYIPPRYGEGKASAFNRLMAEINKLERCIQDLHLTDPRDDKKRIEDIKGGLLEYSYYWIFENSNYQQWYRSQQSRLLWIKGDPGKGKTMLLCGIINELKRSVAQKDLFSYFFCQATDKRINNATAVLRGLLYLLIDQQPSLISHVRKKYDHVGKKLFEDTNAWVALSEIFQTILQDTSLKPTYLVIDALDECVTDLSKLLDLIVYTLSSSNCIKWLLSSRNELHIEQKLRFADEQMRLSLELRENAEQVSHAVDVYIDDKLSRLESVQNDDDLTARVRDILRRKADGTFLWVALVIQELERPESWDPLQVVEEVPKNLHQMYDRMVNQIQQLPKRNAELVQSTRADLSVDKKRTKDRGHVCSFLTTREDQVYLIHQSAKDYLSDERRATIFLSQEKTHHYIFFQSLELISATVRRDIYSLVAPGFSIDQVRMPNQDPLLTTRYSCVYWIDHFCDSVSSHSTRLDGDLQDVNVVYIFLKTKYLYWLEALSLCRSMSEAVVSIGKLEAMIQGRTDAFALIQLIQDARRFIMYHKWTIENNPLQVYASALLFSPARSQIRSLFKMEEPRQIKMKPVVGDEWGACLQTLEGHSRPVNSVAFSPDSTQLASASEDYTVKIWDTSSGVCLQTLEGHSKFVSSIAFSPSPNSTQLASASDDCTVKIWDTSTGVCLQTLEGHSSSISSVAFSPSPNSTQLASASDDCTVKIWDTSTGVCLQTLEGHSRPVNSVAFSPDSTQLASASYDYTVKIWDTGSGVCLQTLEGHSRSISLVAFSPDSTQLASASYDYTVKIWDTSSGVCLQTLEGHSSSVNSVAFSPDSTQLASMSYDYTIRIWDVSSGSCLQILKVDKMLKNISFNTTGSCLHTEIGTIDVGAARLVHNTPIEIATDLRSPEYEGPALSSDGAWITYNSEKVIWLPSEYRPSCSAVFGDMIGIGIGTGRVWMCKISA